jgi:multidrug efflux pump subunit AcrA (membrane-fusion protein)
MKRWLFPLIVALAVALGAWYFIQHGRTRTQAPPARPTAPVAVVPIIASNIELRVPATGNVQAWFDVDVSAQVSDNMRALYVDEGDVVTAGQALAQLDMREIDAMYAAAIAARISAEATIRQMSATLTNALRQYDRSIELLREKVIGQREHDDTELAVKLARGRYDMAHAEYNRLAALEEELAVRRERYTVRAPFDGVIAQCHLDQGAYVTRCRARCRPASR